MQAAISEYLLGYSSAVHVRNAVTDAAVIVREQPVLVVTPNETATGVLSASSKPDTKEMTD